MRHSRAATLILMIALAVTGCGNDGNGGNDGDDRPDPGTSSPTGAADDGGGDENVESLSTEEFCAQARDEVLGEQTDAVAASLRAMVAAYEAGDEAAFRQRADEFEQRGQTLTQGWRDVAARLADPEFGAAMERFADSLDAMIEDITQMTISDFEETPASFNDLQDASAQVNAFCSAGE